MHAKTWRILKMMTKPTPPVSAPLPKCCSNWPHCTHTLALYERWKHGDATSDADIRRLEEVERKISAAAMTSPHQWNQLRKAER